MNAMRTQISVSSVKVTHLVSRQALCHFVMYLLCLFFQEHHILLFGLSINLTLQLVPYNVCDSVMNNYLKLCDMRRGAKNTFKLVIG